jgi:Putative transposase
VIYRRPRIGVEDPTISANEFMRRFLFHVLPCGFVRILNFGFLGNRCRDKFIALFKQLLTESSDTAKAADGEGPMQSIGRVKANSARQRFG